MEKFNFMFREDNLWHDNYKLYTKKALICYQLNWKTVFPLQHTL